MAFQHHHQHHHIDIIIVYTHRRLLLACRLFVFLPLLLGQGSYAACLGSPEFRADVKLKLDAVNDVSVGCNAIIGVGLKPKLQATLNRVATQYASRLLSGMLQAKLERSTNVSFTVAVIRSAEDGGNVEILLLVPNPEKSKLLTALAVKAVQSVTTKLSGDTSSFTLKKTSEKDHLVLAKLDKELRITSKPHDPTMSIRTAIPEKHLRAILEDYGTLHTVVTEPGSQTGRAPLTVGKLAELSFGPNWAPFAITALFQSIAHMQLSPYQVNSPVTLLPTFERRKGDAKMTVIFDDPFSYSADKTHLLLSEAWNEGSLSERHLKVMCNNIGGLWQLEDSAVKQMPPTESKAEFKEAFRKVQLRSVAAGPEYISLVLAQHLGHIQLNTLRAMNNENQAITVDFLKTLSATDANSNPVVAMRGLLRSPERGLLNLAKCGIHGVPPDRLTETQLAAIDEAIAGWTFSQFSDIWDIIADPGYRALGTLMASTMAPFPSKDEAAAFFRNMFISFLANAAGSDDRKTANVAALEQTLGFKLDPFKFVFDVLKNIVPVPKMKDSSVETPVNVLLQSLSNPGTTPSCFTYKELNADSLSASFVADRLHSQNSNELLPKTRKHRNLLLGRLRQTHNPVVFGNVVYIIESIAASNPLWELELLELEAATKRKLLGHSDSAEKDAETLSDWSYWVNGFYRLATEGGYTAISDKTSTSVLRALTALRPFSAVKRADKEAMRRWTRLVLTEVFPERDSSGFDEHSSEGAAASVVSHRIRVSSVSGENPEGTLELQTKGNFRATAASFATALIVERLGGEAAQSILETCMGQLFRDLDFPEAVEALQGVILSSSFGATRRTAGVTLRVKPSQPLSVFRGMQESCKAGKTQEAIIQLNALGAFGLLYQPLVDHQALTAAGLTSRSRNNPLSSSVTLQSESMTSATNVMKRGVSLDILTGGNDLPDLPASPLASLEFPNDEGQDADFGTMLRELRSPQAFLMHCIDDIRERYSEDNPTIFQRISMMLRGVTPTALLAVKLANEPATASVEGTPWLSFVRNGRATSESQQAVVSMLVKGVEVFEKRDVTEDSAAAAIMALETAVSQFPGYGGDDDEDGVPVFAEINIVGSKDPWQLVRKPGGKE